MKRALKSITAVLALSAGPVLAQTADHAPTKPAADAAARYDRSVEQKTGPSDGAKGSDDDGSSGASTGTKNETAPDRRDTAAPNNATGKSK